MIIIGNIKDIKFAKFNGFVAFTNLYFKMASILNDRTTTTRYVVMFGWGRVVVLPVHGGVLV